MTDNGFASVPAVKQYLKMAEDCGVDYQPYLKQCDIDPNALVNNTGRIPGSALEQLLNLLITASGDPLFGLHCARFVQQNSYNVLGYISMNCGNLDEVLTQMPLYEKIVGEIGTSKRVISGGDTCLSFNCHFSDPLVRQHATENVLASWDQFSKNYLHLAGKPLRIHFEHAAPQQEELLEVYRATFGCEVLFNQEFSGTWISREDVYRPIEQANDQLLKTLLEHASQELRQIDLGCSMRDRVKNMLRLMISEKLPSRERLAEEMGMSSRTLQRKLNDEDAHYQQILDELRLELATHYLAREDLGLDDIAFKLGYQETRSFYRGFKHWTGKTVGEFRKELLTTTETQGR
ncbi:MAG: AraC family transcriptional regulator [Halioglobus sp.]